MTGPHRGSPHSESAGSPAGVSGVEPLFTREGETYLPSVHTRGPWDAGSQHGGAPAALLTRAIEALEPAAMLTGRITFDFLRAVPLAPLTAHAAITRPGRRLQLAEAELRCDDEVLVRARAVRLRTGDVALPAIALAPDVLPCAGPAGARHDPFPGETGEEGFHRTGMEIRWIDGSYAEAGPARAWFRFARPLVDDEPGSALALAAAAADFGNGVSRVLAFSEHLFVNTDLTLHLHHSPRGEWVLLDARTVVDPLGAGMAWSALCDEQGPIGLAAQTLFVEER